MNGIVGFVEEGRQFGFAANLDDVRRVAAAGAFGVIRVNRASLERANRILHEARFVNRVGVNRDLHVKLFRDARARNRWLRESCPSLHAASGRWLRPRSARAAAAGNEALPLPKKSQIDRAAVRGLRACGA